MFYMSKRLKRCSQSIIVIVSIFLPVQPLWAHALELPAEMVSAEPSPVKKKKRKRIPLYQKLGRDITNGVINEVKSLPDRLRNLKAEMMHVDYLKTPLPVLAQAAYGDGPLQSPSCIIEQNEVKELLLPDLIGHLSAHTLTAVGAESLQRMIVVHDKTNTLALQDSIRHLVEDDAAFEKVEQLLTSFAKSQRSVYRYWDPHRMEEGHLFNKVKDLYVVELVNWLSKALPMAQSLLKPISRSLENNRDPKFLRLNAYLKIVLRFMKVFVDFGLLPVWQSIKGALFPPLGDLKNPVHTFCDGVATAFHAYNILGHSRHYKKYNDAHRHLVIRQNNLDLFKVQKTRAATVEQAKINFDSDRYKDDPTFNRLKSLKKEAQLFNNYTAQQVQGYGSLLDFYQLQKNRSLAGSSVEWHLGFIGKMIASITGILPSFVSYVAPGQFNASGTLMISNGDNPLNALGSLIIVTFLTAFRMYDVSSRLYQGAAEGTRLIGSGNDFKRHTFFLARALRSITEMHQYLKHDEYFKKTRIAQQLDDVMTDPHESFNTTMKLAHSKAFKKRSSKKVNQGHSLALHPYMQDSKKQIQQALWAIGELDALYSIAKLMREGQKEGHRFCFVEFLPEEHDIAQAHIENGTLLMVPNSKPNSMSLGFEGGNKAILSGPNGAGKSVFIKMFGCNVILAHALGVAVAEKMMLSWLEMVRSSIDPAESIKDEMSKFQMQKNRMESVINAVIYLTQQNAQAKALFLTDEPLSGTTPHLAATYMKEDFERVTGIPQLMGITATHNEEPTRFEGDDIVNYQVCIDRLENGLYVPSFTITPGVPTWWFSLDPADRQKQKKFADYTLAMKQKRNLESDLQVLNKNAQKVATILKEKNYPEGVSVKKARAHYKRQQEILKQQIDQRTFALKRANRKIEELLSSSDAPLTEK